MSKGQCVNSCVNGIHNKSLDISNKINKASTYNTKYDYESTKIHKGSTQSSRRTIVQRINKYNENTLTTIILWLISFVFLLTLALQGFVSDRTDLSQAGWTSTDGTYYANAPMTVIGGSVDETSHTIINTEDNPVKPLFTSKDSTEYTPNSVNTDVLLELLNVVNSSSVWGTKTVSEDGVTYLSAKDFGQYDSATNNAQIVLKLLEDTTTTTNNVNDAAAQYWQVVYRSTSADADVITLYMVDSYIEAAQFNPETTVTEGDKTYRKEGNYSQSYIRDKTVLPTYETMTQEYSQLDQYVVAPYQLSSQGADEIKNSDLKDNTDFLNLGGWQSSAYQTSGNQNNQYYNGTASNSGAATNGDYALGTSGYGANNSYYNVENGLDGLSVSKTNPTVWQGDIVSAYEDKLWVPSAFEVLHTGYGTTNIQDTGRAFDGAELVSSVSSYSGSDAVNATLNGTTSGEDCRTGLWELNGYDRATGSWAWLRSGYSSYNFLARAIFLNGNNDYYSVLNTGGVRVALHLNLKSLASTVLNEINLVNVDANNVVGTDVTTRISNGEWNLSILQKYCNWDNALFNDIDATKPVVIKNDINSSATATYTFDTNKYKMKSFTLNDGTPIVISGESGSGTQNGVCNYSYNVTAEGVEIIINNASTNINVVANIEEAGYTITYNAGNGTGNPYTTPTINSGTSASILNVTDSKLGYKKDGHYFVNWSGSDGGTYTAGQTHTFSGNVTLTAQWSPNVYTINFNSNAPSGAISNGASSMSSQQFTYGVAQTLTPNAFGYKYYLFKGWATSSDSKVVTYADKADLSNLTTIGNGGSMTLYAVWEKTTCSTTLSINFNKPTDKGVFIYILDGTQSSGIMTQQIFVNTTGNIVLELEKTHTYTIIVSKPYTWGITFSGGGTINGTAYTFTTPNATSGSTHTITLTGGSTINGSIIV